jgi:gamma-glutamylputrescine oxidase
MIFNGGLGFKSCYYLATAQEAPRLAALAGAHEPDLAIVGGGASGLSTALHAARAGMKVALLEGGRIGWGASGRNGGQLIPGLRRGALELARAYGPENAKALLELAYEAVPLVTWLIGRHTIDCDLRLTGHLTAAVKTRDFAHMRAEADCHRRLLGGHPFEVLGPAETRRHVDAPYAGGLFDPAGGHLHPLNYALGLARAAAEAGATLFEDSRVVALREDGDGVTLATAAGTLRARHAVLAGDAYLAGVAPAAEARLMPVASYVVATAPLGATAGELLPTDVAVSDSRFVVRYFRLTADGRLLFGSGERYASTPPSDIAAFVRPHLEATFPRLRGVKIDHAWGGLVSITRSRLPHFSRADRIFVAQGYSGMGAALSTLAGKLIAEALAGDSSRFDRFAAVAPPAFPGGRALRGPLHVAGMLWYALRDRL